MPISRDEMVQSLTMLARLCRDSALDYQVAAEEADSKRARQVCANKAAERERMLSEIEEVLRTAGGSPPANGTPAAAAFRDWSVVKAELTPGARVEPLLAECERAEDETRAAFEQVLGRDLPGEVRGLIERQYEQVLSTHAQIRALRDRGRLS
jgi:uncharacterized protein (TIGR02284 family)